MTYQNALRQLRFNKARIFSLIGPEDFLKRVFIEEVRKVYSGYELYTDMEGMHLGFIENKIVLLKDLMEVKELMPKLDGYDGVAIFSFSSATNLKSKDVSMVLSKSCVVECGRLRGYGDDYPLWIMSRMIDAGYEYQDGVEKELFLKIGPDMAALDNELYKLYAVKSDNKKILIDDVDRYVPTKALKSAFDILEFVLRRDASKALHCFKMFNNSNDNLLELVKFMAGYMEKIYKILFLKYKKMDIQEIAGKVNIPVFYIRTKYLPWATSLGYQFIMDKYEELCRLDILMRVFRGNKNILMENFIMGCAR